LFPQRFPETDNNGGYDMPSVKLENGVVGKLIKAAGDRDVITFDSELSGFALRVRNGQSSWIIQYRFQGKQRRLTLGKTLTAAQARGKAKKLLARIELEDDPAAEKDEQRKAQALSLGSLLDDYLATSAKVRRRNTMQMLRLYLATGDYFRALRSMPASAVKKADVARAIRKIEEGHGSVSAVRARASLSSAFSWAMREGMVESNPTIGTNKPADSKPRERVLSDQELAAVWNASGDDHFGRIVRLLVLTGCRVDEIGKLRWVEIDREKRAIALPGERTKNKRAHTIVSDAAIKIVECVPRVVGMQHVFGGAADSGFWPWGRSKAALDARLDGEVKAWVLHDLRRSCATGMAELGVAPHVIEMALNHQSGSKGGIAGIYNRSRYAKEAAQAFALWSDHVAKIAGAKAPKKHEKVSAIGG
jgi:integrase